MRVGNKGTVHCVIIIIVFSLMARYNQKKGYPRRAKKVPFSMAIEKVELMHKCFTKHLLMGTSRMKQDKETEEVKRKRVRIERSQVDKKKEVTKA